jgi:hypothetical protein
VHRGQARELIRTQYDETVRYATALREPGVLIK